MNERFTLRRLACLFTLAALPAGAGSAQDVAGGAVDAAMPIELDVRAQSVHEDHQIHFDENGEPRNENHQLRLQMRLLIDPDQSVMGYENLRVERVVTSAAEELRSQDGPGQSKNLRNVFGQQQDRTQIGLYARLPAPQRPADRLQEVVGRVTLILGVGPLREAVLGPFEDVHGKNATIKGIPGSTLRLTTRDNRLRVELSQDLRDRLDRVRVVNGQGVEIPVQNWGSGGHNNLQYFEFRTPPQPDMHVVLQLFDRLEEREGVFTLRDVPLPVQEPVGGADELVIETRPLGEGLPAERLPQLPVVIEN